MGNQQVVDLMEHVWHSIDSLCSPLTEGQWKTPTECPGWSVQDQVSHLVGAESRILGNPVPDHAPRDTSHVKNDVGQSNEVVVDYRRSWPGQRVLEEFPAGSLRLLGPGFHSIPGLRLRHPNPIRPSRRPSRMGIPRGTYIC